MFSFSATGAGQQCCYDGNSLIVGPPGGGSLDVVSPEKSFWGHVGRDVLPWYACCKFTENCGKYYERRPSDDGSRYVPPPIGKFILCESQYSDTVLYYTNPNHLCQINSLIIKVK